MIITSHNKLLFVLNIFNIIYFLTSSLYFFEFFNRKNGQNHWRHLFALHWCIQPSVHKQKVYPRFACQPRSRKGCLKRRYTRWPTWPRSYMTWHYTLTVTSFLILDLVWWDFFYIQLWFGEIFLIFSFGLVRFSWYSALVWWDLLDRYWLRIGEIYLIDIGSGWVRFTW